MYRESEAMRLTCTYTGTLAASNFNFKKSKNQHKTISNKKYKIK
jgi:hypothetical protein